MSVNAEKLQYGLRGRLKTEHGRPYRMVPMAAQGY